MPSFLARSSNAINAVNTRKASYSYNHNNNLDFEFGGGVDSNLSSELARVRWLSERWSTELVKWVGTELVAQTIVDEAVLTPASRYGTPHSYFVEVDYNGIDRIVVNNLGGQVTLIDTDALQSDIEGFEDATVHREIIIHAKYLLTGIGSLKVMRDGNSLIIEVIYPPLFDGHSAAKKLRKNRAHVDDLKVLADRNFPGVKISPTGDIVIADRLRLGPEDNKTIDLRQLRVGQNYINNYVKLVIALPQHLIKNATVKTKTSGCPSRFQ